MKRNATKNLVVLPSESEESANRTVFDVLTSERRKGATKPCSHYIVDILGDVTALRDKSEVGNEHPKYNKNSVFIKYIGNEPNDAQTESIKGLISVLQEFHYPAAEPLYLTEI